jgi:Helix-turn-helix domain
MSGRRWTDAEELLLEEGFGIVETRTLARRLGRTTPAVHQRALKLGLVADEDLSITACMEILGLGRDSRRLYTWIESGTLPRRSKFNGRRKFVTEEDLIAFIREHGHLLDRDKVQPPYRQYVEHRWITLVEAFKRGAAHYVELEHAAHAGTIPEIKRRGVRYVIPEAILPRLVEGRRRFTTDAEHHRQVVLFNRLAGRHNTIVARKHSLRRRVAA